MSGSENPTTEREAGSTDTGSHLSPRATSALGFGGDPVKKCESCGRKQPAKRTRCTACGAELPEKATRDDAEPSASAPSASPAPASPGPVTGVADPAPEKSAPEPPEEKTLESLAQEALGEKPAAPDKASTDKAATEKAATDKTGSDKTGDEKPAEAAGDGEVTLEALFRAAAAEHAGTEAVAAPVEAKAEGKTEVKTEGKTETKAEPKADAKPEAKADKPRAMPTPTAGVVMKKLVPATTAAAAQAAAAAPAAPRPAAGPPANVAAIVKGEIKTEVAKLEKTVDHLGDQIKAGLTLVAKGQRGLEEKVTVIARATEELAKDTQRRRKDYDALYEEMRQYKINFIDAAQKPLYNDLLLLFDSIQRIMHRCEELQEPAVPKEAVVEAFKQVKDELLEILYRRDIEMIEDHPSKMDVKFQKPVRRVETENAAEDRDVVQCIREGFRRNGVVLRAQDVVVKRCMAVASDEQPIESTDTTTAPTAETPAGEAQAPATETEKKEES